MLPLKPPYNTLHFVNILLSPNFCAFWDTETFLHSYPIFSALSNLTFLTSETQKYKFDKFLPCALSPTQNEPQEPKRFQINPYLDYETAVHILLGEAACRCSDLAHTDLAHLSPNRGNHLKSPKKFENLIQTSFQFSTLVWNTRYGTRILSGSNTFSRASWHQLRFRFSCTFHTCNLIWQA